MNVRAVTAGAPTGALPASAAPDVAVLATRLDRPITARLVAVPGKPAGDAVGWSFPHVAPSGVRPWRGHALSGVLATTTHQNPEREPKR